MRSIVAAVLVAAALVLGIGAARAATLFHAWCESGDGWAGEARDSFDAARADADAHQRDNPGHVALVGERDAP